MSKEFTWNDDECDQGCYNGSTLLMCDMKKEDAKRMCVDLSKCGVKHDFHYAAGRTLIKVATEGYSVAYEQLVKRMDTLEADYNIHSMM